jgi:single-strand DNA-binding protein
MLNRVILIGRLTKDAELNYTHNGKTVTNFTLAAGRKYNKDEVDFVPIVAWGKPAENTAQYTEKGSLVAIEGRLQTRSYEGQDGRRRYVTEVVADDIRFLSRKRTLEMAQAPSAEGPYRGEYSGLPGQQAWDAVEAKEGAGLEEEAEDEWGQES